MLIRRSVVPAALLLVLAAGCANNNTSDAGAPPTAPSADLPSASPEPTAESPAASAPAGSATITGTVRQGVEPGCLLLKDATGDHLLVFKDDKIEATVKAGSEVTVVGKVETGMMTTCMQGEPFVVSSVAAN
ncbi:hypothetical protein [Actinoplanes sp. GCM10030250]|uniref:hypothetical protein n=1 Tax=Actinoplanes sp. GCM10030250 TaxID=3273376 RepID=UPI0036198DD6